MPWNPIAWFSDGPQWGFRDAGFAIFEGIRNSNEDAGLQDAEKIHRDLAGLHENLARGDGIGRPYRRLSPLLLY